MSLAQPAAWGQFAFLVFAFGCLTYAFMTDDFSVAYVASNSNSALPWYYKFSAVWGAHEGSLLLWALILGGWTFAVSVFSRQLPQVMLARVLAVMGMISTGLSVPDPHVQPVLAASCRRFRRTVVTSIRCCRTSA
jgi:cytochrome c-type biogenesis protein CcmF